MNLVLQLPEHIGRLLFHILQDGDLVGQIGDGGNLRHQRVYLLFEVVVHSVKDWWVLFLLCKDTEKSQNT